MSRFILRKVTRVEVINHFDGMGRMYVFAPAPAAVVEAQLQDDGRTLKVFILDRKEKTKEIIP